MSSEAEIRPIETGTEQLLCRVEARVGVLTLNRPEARNALSVELKEALLSAATELGRDPGVGCLLLTGAGGAFCAGGDLSELPSGDRAAATTPETIRQWLHDSIQAVGLALSALDIPTIAAVNGTAAGAGMDIASACDLRIGSPGTRFLIAYTRVGLFPGGGGTWLLPRIAGVSKALELIYTNEAVGADEALDLSLLNQLADSDETLLSKTNEIATRIAQGPPIALRLAKLNVYSGLNTDFRAALDMVAAAETITLTSEDHREGVAAMRERQDPEFRGA